MAGKPENDSHKMTQSDRFRNAAKEHDTDDDEARFDERLKRVSERKPAAPKAGRPSD